MINELVQGKKVGVIAVLAIMSGIAGTIWAGALLWDQIQDNTKKIDAVTIFNDDELWSDIEENTNNITRISTSIDNFDLTGMRNNAGSITRLEEQGKDLRKDVAKNSADIVSLNPIDILTKIERLQAELNALKEDVRKAEETVDAVVSDVNPLTL